MLLFCQNNDRTIEPNNILDLYANLKNEGIKLSNQAIIPTHQNQYPYFPISYEQFEITYLLQNDNLR